MDLLEGLLEIKSLVDSGDCIGKKNGICFLLQIRGVSSIQMLNLGQLIRSWPKFSGCGIYPVPPFTPCKPIDCYDFFSRGDRFWDKNTQYGRNRIELLDFLIDLLKAKSNQEEPSSSLYE